jgi:addiction module HigA family antidote
MTKENQFMPDYAIPPGETLTEELAAQSMSQAELALLTSIPKETINEIIKGNAPITSEIALKLERVFQLPAHFWINLEQQYQETLIRLQVNQAVNF